MPSHDLKMGDTVRLRHSRSGEVVSAKISGYNTDPKHDVTYVTVEDPQYGKYEVGLDERGHSLAGFWIMEER